MRIGIYPGSFDPLTNGHLDIIERSKGLCDKLVVAIAINRAKQPLFSVEERLEIINNYYEADSFIEVVSFEGLLVEFCRARSINYIVRGVRNITDFEYEMANASVNSKLAPEIETIFLMTKGEYSFISSKMVKEIASFKGDLASLVPPIVIKKVNQKYSDMRV
ncbi:MAG TPA: pantetheine-phosphate adenylyltransferase [Spirochaetota bacterium]|nr:pantetheine-phosphate adenylyltransferase [Spirochaetota bacterium]HOD14232.1 pantetheine-phosphate adenylyltransferase [Spirochaetota bacterium]HPG51291.1 pantetheine-phosphate adenylyltransferase [Spirochaetota bacterium]HPN13712.1 pantetheine-phosphate adenylyltransferase [Spirochaetota bacterium]HQL83859.1 pantetheine-phosphate adenylyltransferase [Spirochaetota bacterium]